jgi:hypothetical protein
MRAGVIGIVLCFEAAVLAPIATVRRFVDDVNRPVLQRFLSRRQPGGSIERRLHAMRRGKRWSVAPARSSKSESPKGTPPLTILAKPRATADSKI